MFMNLKLYNAKSHFTVARDLALHGTPPSSPAGIRGRRHSLSVCETPVRARRQKKIFVKSDSTSTSSSGRTSTATSGTTTPISGQATPKARESPKPGLTYTINTPEMHANLQSEFLQSVRSYYLKLFCVIIVTLHAKKSRII